MNAIHDTLPEAFRSRLKNKHETKNTTDKSNDCFLLSLQKKNKTTASINSPITKRIKLKTKILKKSVFRELASSSRRAILL